MRLMIFYAALILCLMLSAAGAEENQIFDGITPLELVSILRQSGVEVRKTAKPVTPKSRLIELSGSQVILRGCDEKNRCRSEFLRIISFGMV